MGIRHKYILKLVEHIPLIGKTEYTEEKKRIMDDVKFLSRQQGVDAKAEVKRLVPSMIIREMQTRMEAQGRGVFFILEK